MTETPSTRLPYLIIDEASTARVSGWALDPDAPAEPVFLRFLVNGVPVWEGACDNARPDVGETHPSEHVGFDFLLPPALNEGSHHVLTVQDRRGRVLHMSIGGHGTAALPLAPAEQGSPGELIHSHIDSFRNGRVQGWVLRSVSTPEGPRLLGCCTVLLVQDGRVLAQTTADIPRPDVASALQGEERCGFVMEIPDTRRSASVVRVLVMPERRELSGSPCVLRTLPGFPSRMIALPVPATAPPIPAAAPAAGPKCAVCAIVRDEARDLPEWLAYQTALGFDAIVVYDNLSIDETPQVLKRASNVMDLRTVSWPRIGEKGQEAAYQDCIDRFGQEFEWIAFIDIDEFLVPQAHAGIKGLLQQHTNSAQVVTNWATFGSNGQTAFPQRLVIESFTRRAPSTFGPNAHVKSIVRPRAVRSVVNPHVMDVGDEAVVLSDGRPVEWESAGLTRTPADYAVCQINHYFVRSRAHWEEKMRKGYHFSPIRRTERDFADYDRNEVVDTSALRFAPRVHAALRRIGLTANVKLAEPVV